MSVVLSDVTMILVLYTIPSHSAQVEGNFSKDFCARWYSYSILHWTA